MAFVEINENPRQKRVGDCVVRAISTALGQTWDVTYLELMVIGYLMCDIPSANYVWGAYLKDKGFERCIIPNECADCYSVRQFADDNRNGTYILALNNHVVAVRNGDYFDTWDCGDKIPLYFWKEG